MSEYLKYERRGRGMDHGRYDWAPLPERNPVAWPHGGDLALVACVILEWFRFDRPASPVAVQGAPTKEYPDYREWTLRDYGLRVGVFRLMEVLRSHGIKPTVAVNAEVCRRFPELIDALGECELVAHGETASLPLHPGMSVDEERETIRRSLDTIRAATGRDVRGWMSPSLIETPRTLDILAVESIEYVMDWVNDDVPYHLRTSTRPLVSVPGPWELNDVNTIWTLKHPSHEFGRQVVDTARYLLTEAKKQGGGRVLTLGLRPWIVGQAHRIGDIEDALQAVMGMDGVVNLLAGDVADALPPAAEAQ